MKSFPGAVRMENYTELLYKLAYRCWEKMPNSSKSWISVDDLVQDGLIAARFNLLPKWDARRAGFMTILQLYLEQFYSRKLRNLYRKKRLQVELAFNDEDVRFSRSIDSCLTMEQMYEEASPLLKRYMYKWFFGDSGVPQRIRLSVPFKEARKEFRRLSKKHHVDAETCRQFLESRKQKSFA